MQDMQAMNPAGSSLAAVGSNTGRNRGDVNILRGIPYGSAIVGWSSPAPTRRTLAMDVYLPHGTSSSPRPAIVMAFGGAFHRGCKEDDSFEAEGKNTAVAEYCERFAQRGYVAASVDYRLVPEDPSPGDTPVVSRPQDIPTSRVSYVRQVMGLPPATPAMLWAGIEAASDDMRDAIAFLHAKAGEWNIDPRRVVAGGFSAGARTALNAAFGEKARVAAVISLSGYIDVRDLRAQGLTGASAPPVLLVNGSRDLDYIIRNMPDLTACMTDLGIRHEHWVVKDAGHFYPRTAAADRCGGQPAECSVEDAMAGFLDATL